MRVLRHPAARRRHDVLRGLLSPARPDTACASEPGTRGALRAVRRGKRCFCCGETEEAFLAFDHVNDDGAQHRREIAARNWGVSIYHLYLDLKRRGFPPVLQVSCHNCNMGRYRNGGVCPHQAAKVAVAS